jgi:hypothetical protein
VPPSILVRNGELVILPRNVEFPPTTIVFLVIAHVASLAAPAVIAHGARKQFFEFERRTLDTAARLRQLLPKDARDAAGRLDEAIAEDVRPRAS